MAYEYASNYSLPNMISWCNLQLTKDGVGYCLPELNIGNNTNVDMLFPSKKTTYTVNNVPVTGWFPSDFTYTEIILLRLTQGVRSRAPDFDYTYRIKTVEQVSQNIPRDLWLNIQYDDFYKQRGLSMTDYVKDIIKSVQVKYVSSPEVSFLLSLHTSFESTNTKLVFQFPEDSQQTEITSGRTYDYFLKHLPSIRKYAEAILVPKSYIWPVDSDSYLLPHTSLVSDAHNAGLQVFVSGITNDVPFAYDFNFDPVAENLAFIDNHNFSVDGVISDFPLTPSAAIDCFSHMGKDDPPQKNALVISHEGASGVYPGCTDLAYKAALDDGVDVIDCPVQMTKDGLPICLGSINLMKKTNVAQSRYGNLSRDVPELGGTGIFTFDLDWDQYQDLQTEILNPDPAYHLNPNPRFKNAGKLTPLWVLLNTIIRHNQNSSKQVSGLFLSIDNADFLSNTRRLDVISAVVDALTASYITNSGIKIMIGSSEKSVLLKFKEISDFERVYEMKEDIRLVDRSVINDMKNFAQSVVISKDIEYVEKNNFLSIDGPIIPQIKNENFKVYLKGFRNEFVYQPWDFLSDPYVELNTFVEGGADGVITDFPGTAANYRRNRCLGMSKRPSYMTPIKPGELLKYIPHDESMSQPSTTQSSHNYTSNRRLGMHKKTYSTDHV